MRSKELLLICCGDLTSAFERSVVASQAASMGRDLVVVYKRRENEGAVALAGCDSEWAEIRW